MNRFRRCGLLLALFVPWCARYAMAERPIAGREIDMLAAMSGGDGAVTWKYYSQDPKSKCEDVWRMAGDVLVCRGTPRGYLYTEQRFTNFVLRLEWRVPVDAKPHTGGVLVRMTGKHRIWPKSLEAQINHPDAGDFWGLDGFRLDGPADRKKTMMHKQYGLLTHLKKTVAAEKPLGQWNRYEITLRGGAVTLRINGKQVNRATGCDVVAGPICLTAEGNEIHFRHVGLTPIIAPAK